MTNIFVKVFGHVETAGRLAAGAATMSSRTDAVVRHYGQLMQTKIQAHASGRPGPNAPTGNYRRSIHVEFGQAGGGLEARVGTNAPQGRRLEFGFVGTDSLGRHYNQPPFPHFGPAANEVEPEFVAALAAVAMGI